MKAYWQGILSSELVTLPVKLYPVATHRGPQFHYLHAFCRTPLEYLRHCPHCDTEVSGENIVRGYEYDDSLVIVSEAEFSAVSSKDTEHLITLRQCVFASAVDPVAFDRAYYVEPGPGAKKSYALLFDALQHTDMVALGTATLREHDHTIVLRPAPGVLALHTLFTAAELLAPERLALPHRPPAPVETKAARKWISRLSQPYIPEQWGGRFQTALSTLLAQKAKTGVDRVSMPPSRTRRQKRRLAVKAAA